MARGMARGMATGIATDMRDGRELNSAVTIDGFVDRCAHLEENAGEFARFPRQAG